MCSLKQCEHCSASEKRIQESPRFTFNAFVNFVVSLWDNPVSESLLAQQSRANLCHAKLEASSSNLGSQLENSKTNN